MLTGATVLVVEDEELVALELCALLSELGYEVCGTAATGPEALRLAGERKPGFITMDINLGAPGQGFAVMTLIRTSDLITPVLFVTGGAEPDAGDAVRAIGRSGYVAKPFGPSDIARALERLFEDDGED